MLQNKIFDRVSSLRQIMILIEKKPSLICNHSEIAVDKQ